MSDLLILSPALFVVAVTIAAAGALVQGSIGFGLGMVAAPVLMLIDARFVPGPLLLASLTLTVLMLRREHHAIDFSGVGWALSGRLVGTVTGAAAVTLLSAQHMAVLFGGLVLFAVLLSVSGLRFRPVVWTLVPAGVLSGLMGTTTSIGGPPIALVYQSEEAATVRGTLSSYFAAGIMMSILALALVGHLGLVELALAVALLPGVFAGFHLSHRAIGLLGGGVLRPIVLVTSAAAAIVVLVRALG